MTEKKYTKADLLEREVKNLKDQNATDHKTILEEIACINEKLDNLFVTKTEFEPYKKTIWFIITAIASAVIAYSMRVVFSHGII